MDNNLQYAQERLSNIRFVLDEQLNDPTLDNLDDGSRLKSFANLQHLKITEGVTPKLYESLETVLDRLGIPHQSVEAFVFNSPEIQAECFSLAGGQCVLRFSSGLVDLLDNDEFKFVVGHELGHFLYSHIGLPGEGVGRTFRQLKQSRYQEVSADRVGLIGCNSLDVAIKALVKSSSGLNGSHLRFDVGTYLNQLKKAEEHSSIIEEYSTHPSSPLRCKALFWFSLVNDPLQMKEETLLAPMSEVDNRVSRDLIKYSESYTASLQLQILSELELWSKLDEVSSKGSFTKSDQVVIADAFGPEMLQKALNFYEGKTAGEAQEHAKLKVIQFRQQLHDLGY